MLEKFLKKYSLFIPLALTIIITLLTLRHGQIIAGGDVPLYEKATKYYLDTSRYLWNSIDGLGRVSTTMASGGMLYLIQALFVKFISPSIVQKIIYTVLALAPIFSLNFFINRIFKDEKKYLISLIACVFYIFNLYQLQTMSFGLIIFQISYVFTPLLLGMLLRKYDGSKNMLYFSIALLFNAACASNLAIFSSQCLMFFLFTLWHIIFSNERIKEIKFYLKYLILFLIFNSFWIIGFINSYWGNIANLNNNDWNQTITQGSIQAAAQYNILLNTFRLISSSLYGFWLGKYDFPFYKIYEQPFFVLLNFSFIAIIFYTIIKFIKKSVNKKYLLLFLGFIILGVFLVKGAAEPFGKLYIKLMNSFSWMSMFRTPQNKFGILLALSYSILFGWGVKEIIEVLRIKSLYKSLLYLSIIILICINLFPFWQGKMFFEKYHNKIPNYYDQVANDINNDNKFERVLILPFYESTWISTDWNYIGYDPLYYYINKPYFARGSEWLSNYNTLADQQISLAINTKNSDQFQSLLKNYNIGKIIIHNDYDYSTFDLANLGNNFKDIISNSNLIKFDKSYGKLDIYDVNFNKNQEISLANKPLLKEEDLMSPLKYTFDDLINYDIYFESTQNKDKIPNLQSICDYKSYTYDYPAATINDNEIIFSDKINTNSTILSKSIGKSDNNFELNTNNSNNFAVNYSSQEIKLNNPSFENKDNLWEMNDSSPLENGKSQFSTSSSTDTIDGKYSLKLETNNHILGLRQKIDEITQNSLYSLSFDYKYISGSNPRFVVEGVESDNSGKNLNNTLVLQDLDKNSGWNHKQIIFNSQQFEKIYIWFYSAIEKGIKGVNLYDNVKLSKINLLPFSFLTYTNAPQSDQLPIFSQKKINETKYNADISGSSTPFFVKLNQSFSPKWKLYIIKNGKKLPVDEDYHFVSDSYSNSWYITEKGNLKIIIEYSSQKYLQISFLVILITLLLLTYNFLQKRGK